MCGLTPARLPHEPTFRRGCATRDTVWKGAGTRSLGTYSIRDSASAVALAAAPGHESPEAAGGERVSQKRTRRKYRKGMKADYRGETPEQVARRVVV